MVPKSEDKPDRPAADTFEPLSPMREALRMFLRNRAAILGVVVMTIVLLVTFAGRWLYPVDPFEIAHAPFTPPGTDWKIPLGSDHLGRDVLAGIISGGTATLAVGAVAAMLTIFIGVTIGALAGYYGGVVDEMLMRVTEFFQVLPALILAMVLVSLFSPTLKTVAVAIGIVSWPATARLTRAEFMRIRQLDYVKAARAIASSDAHIIWRVVLPNALPPLIVSATLVIGVAILFEAGLSFLGLGDPNIMSWGLMIGTGRPYFLDAWWTVTLPGAAIFLTVLAVSLIGDGLNDAFNPKLRER
jgi:peptide/nickel transport system permease protein